MAVPITMIRLIFPFLYLALCLAAGMGESLNWFAGLPSR